MHKHTWPRVGTWGGSVPTGKNQGSRVRKSENISYLKLKLYRTGQFCLANFSNQTTYSFTVDIDYSVGILWICDMFAQPDYYTLKCI